VQVEDMKRICLVEFDMSVVGGAEKVTASLANALCKKYRVYLYEINKREELAYQLDASVIYIAGLKDKKRLREMIREHFFRFIKFVKAHRIDTVISIDNYPTLVVSPTRFFTRAKYIYCDHGGLMNQWNEKDITAIRFWDSFMAHRVVVLTEKTKNDYIEKFHIKPEKMKCIYNWIEDEVLEARRPYNTQSHLILSVGRFGEEKGYDILVKIAGKVLPSHPDWQWHVYGTGETFDEIAEQVRQQGLEKQLLLKGNVENVYQRYPEYAFFVMTSYREGLPLVLLEAAALGIPMISFDIETGPNEIIIQGENGYLIPAYDTGQMADRLVELMEDENKRKYLAWQVKMADKFNKANILKQWIELIEE